MYVNHTLLYITVECGTMKTTQRFIVYPIFFKFHLSSIKCLYTFSIRTLLIQQKAGMYGLAYQPLESCCYNCKLLISFLALSVISNIMLHHIMLY